MKGILADINIQGHVDLLVKLLQGEPWQMFWDPLRMQYFQFSEVGLHPGSPDSEIWDTCQKRELVLITENRNKNDPDSLEATILARNTASCLPVFTLANVQKFRQSRAYANLVIERLLDFLERIDDLRGTGRLFLP